MIKRFLVTIVCLITGLAAQAAVKIEHWTTPTGARVYFVASRTLPMLDVEIDFSAGSAYEPEGGRLAGLAALTSELIDTGAAGVDEEQIAARLADIGARLSSRVDYDRSTLILRTLSSPAEREAALGLLRVVLSTPTFPRDAFEREQTRRIAAIQEAETRPESIVARRFNAAIYPNHPYGVEATAQTVGAITRDDVLSFWRGHYGARRAVISIIGDITRADAEHMAVALTSGLPDAPPAEMLPEISLPQRQTLRIPHPAVQTHILMGLPAVKRDDPDFFPLLVGNYVLGGGGFVSRLMKEVREKRGLAYSVYSYLAPRALEGPFEIGLQTKRSPGNEALDVVETTLRKFLHQGPSERELRAAKQNLIDGQALRLDSNAKILATVAAIGYFGLPLTWIEDYPRHVGAVSANAVRQAFARRVQPEHMVTVIVAGD